MKKENWLFNGPPNDAFRVCESNREARPKRQRRLFNGPLIPYVLRFEKATETERPKKKANEIDYLRCI